MGDKNVINKIFRPNGEKVTNNLLRKLGFIAISICEISLNVNFFQSLGESWVMPVCGVVLVFMEAWHWISFYEAYGLRKALHFVSWFAICLTSILAVVSFGQTITSVSSDKTVAVAANEKAKSNSRDTLYKAAETEYNNAQKQINTINDLLSVLGPYDKGPQERLDGQMKDAVARQIAARKDMEKYSGAYDKEEDVTKITVEDVKKKINARIIFSQVFTEKYTDVAIKGFFIVFGIAMELTFSLSAMPIQRGAGKKKKRKIIDLIFAYLYARIDFRLKKAKRNEAVKDIEHAAKIKTYVEKPIKVIENTVFKEEITIVEEQAPIEKKIIKPSIIEEPVREPIIEESVKEESIDEPIMDEPIDEKPVVEESIKEEISATKTEHKTESETAFLYAPTAPKVLSQEEKDQFVKQVTDILNIIKTNGEKELSIQEISKRTGVSIDNIKSMFRFFFNRNLLAYDEVVKRWRFKLQKDNILNYLKTQTIKF